jgi:hypothetical protein
MSGRAHRPTADAGRRVRLRACCCSDPLRSRQSVISKVRSTKSESDVSHDAAQPVGPVNGGTVTINKRRSAVQRGGRGPGPRGGHGRWGRGYRSVGTRAYIQPVSSPSVIISWFSWGNMTKWAVPPLSSEHLSSRSQVTSEAALPERHSVLWGKRGVYSTGPPPVLLSRSQENPSTHEVPSLRHS